MTDLLREALDRAAALPAQEQDALALMLLDEFTETGGWLTSTGGDTDVDLDMLQGDPTDHLGWL